MIADFYQGVHAFGVHPFEGGGVAEQTCYENQKCEFVRPKVNIDHLMDTPINRISEAAI